MTGPSPVFLARLAAMRARAADRAAHDAPDAPPPGSAEHAERWGWQPPTRGKRCPFCP